MSCSTVQCITSHATVRYENDDKKWIWTSDFCLCCFSTTLYHRNCYDTLVLMLSISSRILFISGLGVFPTCNAKHKYCIFLSCSTVFERHSVHPICQVSSSTCRTSGKAWHKTMCVKSTSGIADSSNWLCNSRMCWRTLQGTSHCLGNKLHGQSVTYITRGLALGSWFESNPQPVWDIWAFSKGSIIWQAEVLADTSNTL